MLLEDAFTFVLFTWFTWFGVDLDVRVVT